MFSSHISETNQGSFYVPISFKTLLGYLKTTDAHHGGVGSVNNDVM
jgi:hypothetical protein